MNVLIIEDDLRIAEINRRFVEKVPGYQVIGIAADGLQAKEQLEVLQPDLVLLDIFFPDMNGLELLRYIKEHHRTTDVIMITASKEVETVQDALRSGVFDFIVKPLVFERFQKTLVRFQDYRQKVDRLKKERGPIGQEEIDGLIHSAGEKKESYLPKGIDTLTLEKITAVISQEHVGLTAEAVGRQIGVSRSTARRYLEFLVSKEEVIADLSYGDVGRPERVYRGR
ncbi:response regulator [Tumebacillus flagellatus]|uniref:Transcriptional regulatory protein n=1 Tax=Tumebacillus flagellatus TaxID=1157490 RepID=A0A074LPC4_9BACL|nr:response regulator [Tumebacillus flagellatus]KEO84006.1 chemotaxis protein CheY [Tumebacillus flagellatus]